MSPNFKESSREVDKKSHFAQIGISSIIQESHRELIATKENRVGIVFLR